MEISVWINHVCVFILGAGAACMDYFTWRISNLWIFVWFVSGFIYGIAVNGIENMYTGLFGAFIPILLLSWMFYFGLIGAGDIKLFCAVGMWIGHKSILICMLVAFTAAAAVSAAKLALYGNALERFKYMCRYFLGFLKTGVRNEYGIRNAAAARVHVSLFVFVSVIFRIIGVYE